MWDNLFSSFESGDLFQSIFIIPNKNREFQTKRTLPSTHPFRRVGRHDQVRIYSTMGATIPFSWDINWPGDSWNFHWPFQDRVSKRVTQTFTNEIYNRMQDQILPLRFHFSLWHQVEIQKNWWVNGEDVAIRGGTGVCQIQIMWNNKIQSADKTTNCVISFKVPSLVVEGRM